MKVTFIVCTTVNTTWLGDLPPPQGTFLPAGANDIILPSLASVFSFDIVKWNTKNEIVVCKVAWVFLKTFRSNEKKILVLEIPAKF